MTEIQAELDSAITTARHALEQFNAAPVVPAKCGSPRLSPWFRVRVQASEVAARWHRQPELEKPEPSIDDEIDRLLRGGGVEP